jgi:hypothetical protein
VGVGRKIMIALGLIGLSTPTHAKSSEQFGSMGLREMVFNTSPQDIGITKEKYVSDVWGLIVETGFTEGSVSLVALADGTSSLYFSNGGAHQNVQKESAKLIEAANHFYKEASRIQSHPLPKAHKVIFYFLTFDGLLAYEAEEDSLDNNKDKFSPLFYATHNVIGELRKIESKD